ncbi:HEAT repeat domain-containing protein [Lusitaniella coriacea]|uniref:HEAT repeat domain-containing protein n=1 Tax=Lusitaniella coriacea TaxID=1983105 RepID=UPI003CEA918D
MSQLTEALDRIESWLVKHQPELALGLEPGLSRQEIDTITTNSPNSFPEELYELYQWHNGSTSYGFIPFYESFDSLQKSLEWYQECVRDGYLESHLFTVLMGEYEHYAVALGEHPNPVWYIVMDDCIEEIRWNSLTDLMLATAECYETGAYYLDENGSLQEDEQKVYAIACKYNYQGSEPKPLDESSFHQTYYSSHAADRVNLSDPDAFEQLTQLLKPSPVNPIVKVLRELVWWVTLPIIKGLACLTAIVLKGFAIESYWAKTGGDQCIACLENTLYRREGQAIAVRRLAELDDPRAIDPLVAALRDRASYVRAAAIEALGKLGDTRAIEPLIRCLRDRDVRVCNDSARVLGELGDRKAIEPLIQLLRRDKYSSRASGAIAALGKFKEPRIIDDLLGILHQRHKDSTPNYGFLAIRENLVSTLAAIEEPRTTEALIEILRDSEIVWKSPNLGYNATLPTIIQALLQRGDSRLPDLLKQWLQDSDCEVRRAMFYAINRVSDPSLNDLLILGLSEEDLWVRKMTIEALGKHQTVEAVSALISILKDTDEDIKIRLLTIRALENNQNIAALEALIEILQDENDRVRGTAAFILRKIGDKRAIEPLNHCLRDRASLVRKIAKEALDILHKETASSKTA